MANHRFTRRGFIKGAAATAGLLGASRLSGGRLIKSAYAADEGEAPALFIIWMNGGYNALFSSADSFLGRNSFGVTSNNIKRIGQSDLYVDRASLGSLPNSALQRMATIGVRHGISAHPAAQQAMWMDGNKSYPVQLAAALGGEAAVRCATVGTRAVPGVHRAIGGVSMQRVRDLKTTLSALGVSTAADQPDRALAAGGLASASSMSEQTLIANPNSGAPLTEGYPSAVAMLTQDTIALDYAEMASAYGINPNASGVYPTAVRSVKQRFLAAEVMIHSGVNVVSTVFPGWDSHGDRNGSEVRNRIQNSGITDALRTFVTRTQAMAGRNVVVAIFGDFARSLPGSDHQPNLSATVIGKRVKLGTTGRCNRNVGLPSGTPGIRGLWSYLGAALGVDDNPFGNNPHGLIV